MKDVMIDIETLGTGPESVITQIGACWFDWEGNVGPTFLKNVELSSATDLGMKMDPQTVKWWFEQGNPTWLKDAEPARRVLSELADFCRPAENIWSHATFDFVILQNAYRMMGNRNGLGYRKARDIRTLVMLSGLTVNKEDCVAKKTHNGLDDCLYQVEYCTKCYKAIKGG